MHLRLLRTQGDIEEIELEPAQMPTYDPGPGRIRVRVSTCALCHTDLHIAEGDLPLHRNPVCLGHQIVGVVDAVGSGVSRFRPGDRVGAGWLFSVCGSCRNCGSERENLCEEAQFTGYDVDGGYAEFATLNEQFTFSIPAGFSDVDATPLLCGGVIGYRAYRASGARPGDVLGLYGFGSSAHIVLQLARHEGCEVRVYTRSDHHRQLAMELGAEWAGTAEEGGPEEMDAAIIFAPAGALVPVALASLRKGGTLVLAGIHMSPIPEMDYRLLYGERVLRSVANFTRADAEEMLRLAAEVPVRVKTEVFRLDQATEALRRLKRGEIDGSAVLRVSEAE